jgi:hypothetical protein
VIKKLIRATLIALLLSILPHFLVPVAGGLWYAGCGDRYVEQEWLDRAVSHLKVLRAHCGDPDLQNVLDYAITRYHKIGAWDVMVMPLANINPKWKTVGCNFPFVPGITIDPEVMSYDIHEGAMVLAHESLHDWFPYFFHYHVTHRIEKLDALWAGRSQWHRP